MAKILRQVTVVRDGMHNAFTDLQYWQGCYWVSYRKASEHVAMDGRAVVALSSDRTRFRELAELKVPGDNRDPKLLPVSEDRLALYWPSWTKGVPNAQALRQFITFSPDGSRWEKPQMILGPGQWLWRIRHHDGRYYGLIQNILSRGGETRHGLELASSEDLISWRTVAHVGSEEQGMNESDIHWFDDGEAWIVARSDNEKHYGRPISFFASARAPYSDWQVTEIPTRIHAPVFLKHKDVLYVAGRRKADEDPTWPFGPASLGVWKVTRGAVEPVLNIPATGDCSYPGFIHDPEGRICMSYYSMHAYEHGVIPRPARQTQDQFVKLGAADVFFAELELP